MWIPPPPHTLVVGVLLSTASLYSRLQFLSCRSLPRFSAPDAASHLLPLPLPRVKSSYWILCFWYAVIHRFLSMKILDLFQARLLKWVISVFKIDRLRQWFSFCGFLFCLYEMLIVCCSHMSVTRWHDLVFLKHDAEYTQKKHSWEKVPIVPHFLMNVIKYRVEDLISRLVRLVNWSRLPEEWAIYRVQNCDQSKGFIVELFPIFGC